MEAELQQLARYKLIEIIIWLVGLSSVFIVGYYVSDTLFKAYLLFIFIALWSSMLFVMSRKCPRCGNYFHGVSRFQGNTLRRTCLHCELHISGNNV